MFHLINYNIKTYLTRNKYVFIKIMDNEKRMATCRLLRILRENQHISQEKMANTIGVSRQQIIRLEKGSFNFNLDLPIAYFNILSINILESFDQVLKDEITIDKSFPVSIEKIAAALKLLREQTQLDTQELADKCGLSSKSILRMESANNFRIDSLNAYLNVFDLDITNLISYAIQRK